MEEDDDNGYKDDDEDKEEQDKNEEEDKENKEPEKEEEGLAIFLHAASLFHQKFQIVDKLF